MAYHLALAPEFTNYVRAVARDQVGRALQLLGDNSLSVDEQLHQARKRCKTLRGSASRWFLVETQAQAQAQARALPP